MGVRGVLFPEDGADAIYSALGEISAQDYKAAMEALSPAIRDAFLAGSEFMEGVACSLWKIKPLPVRQLGSTADKIALVVREEGLAEWMKAVDVHHNQTLRHSIAVAGYAAAFGEALDLVETDIRLLAMSGLLHDLGKMLIPTSILDKVGRLDKGEIATIAEHPTLGAKILKNQHGVDQMVIDAVRSHHELLDGSG
jgi:putative nucleotidyltransferase with HDIG domain